MPEIDLDKIVPEDIVFKYRGDEWTVPGDIDVETRYVLVQITNDLARAEGLLEGPDGKRVRDGKAQERHTRRLKAELLKLLQVHHPDLEELPFKGEAALSAVFAQIMVAIGIAAKPEKKPGPPTRAKRSMKVPKGQPKKRQSRSSGSSSRSAKR